MSEIRKKFINSPDSVVEDALKGLVATDNRLIFHPHNSRVVIRRDFEQLKEVGKVTIASGGGSGHEPFSAGLVGPNSLTAAIAGDVFASPPSTHVSDALEAIQSSAGSLIYVINYTGDRLNFGMAIERFKSGSITKIDLIYIDDDVALENKQEVTIGGRGLAGALLVLQIAGVLADQNSASFEEVRDTSRKVIENLATFGVSIYPCAIPGKSLMFELPDDQIELGLGIHGEPGLERFKLLPARDVVSIVLTKLTSSKRLGMIKKTPLVVLINNLGSVSQIEFGILQGEIVDWFLKNGYEIPRIFSGTLMTSLDGHGFSVTILKLVDDTWLKLLNTPSHISSLWKSTEPRNELVKLPTFKEYDESILFNEREGVEVEDEIASKIEKALRRACRELIDSEQFLNKLDSYCGDGDCGTSLRLAATAILKSADMKRLSFNRPKSICLQLSRIFESSVGGTSGALYALLFDAASRAFDSDFGNIQLREAIVEALKAISYYGHSKPGFRTLLDPLSAAANSKSSWKELVEAAEKSAEETAQMSAKSGRASYTSTEHQSQPDAGAKALAIWIRAVFDSLN